MRTVSFRRIAVLLQQKMLQAVLLVLIETEVLGFACTVLNAYYEKVLLIVKYQGLVAYPYTIFTHLWNGCASFRQACRRVQRGCWALTPSCTGGHGPFSVGLRHCPAGQTPAGGHHSSTTSTWRCQGRTPAWFIRKCLYRTS